MNYKKKLNRLISKIDVDDSNSIDSIYSKNHNFIRSLSDDDSFLLMLCSIECDESKIIKFFDCCANHVVFRSSTFINHFDEKGNNFLHTAVINSHSPEFIQNFIKILYSVLVIDCGFSQPLILRYIMKPLNFQNKNGETFIHLLIKNVIQNKQNVTAASLELISYVVDHGFNIYLKDNSGKDVNSLLDEAGVKPYLKLKLTFDENTNRQAKILFQQLYKKDISNLIKEFNGNKEHDICVVEKIFDDINYCDEQGSLLMYCTNILYDTTKVLKKSRNDYFLECAKKLLRIGVNPNFRDKDGKTFICNVIDKGDIQLVLDLLKLSIKYGFDLNSEPNLIDYCLKNYRDIPVISFNDLLRLYKFLCLNGFDTVISDVDIEKYSDSFTGTSFLKFKDFHYFNYDNDLLINILKDEGLICEDNFKEKFNKIMYDIVNLKERVKNFGVHISDGYFINEVADIIINNRNTYINVTNEKVTVEEVMDAIKILFLQEQKDFFEDFEDCKIKVLNYTNN